MGHQMAHHLLDVEVQCVLLAAEEPEGGEDGVAGQRKGGDAAGAEERQAGPLLRREGARHASVYAQPRFVYFMQGTKVER